MTDLTTDIVCRLANLEQALQSQTLNGICADLDADIDAAGASQSLIDAGWLFYKHLAVNYRGGIRLTKSGAPLRGSKVSVYATDVSWVGYPGGKFTTPQGEGGSAGSPFRYRGVHKYGILFLQDGNGYQQNITGTSSGSAQTFNISNSHDIRININDGDNNPAYEDNWGAFSIYIRIDQP